MYYPSLKEFKKLSKKGNLIPVYKEILADLETPVSAFMKIRDDSYAFLLESVEGAERVAQFSFLGSQPSLIFKSQNNSIQVIEKLAPKTEKKYTVKFKPDPLAEIKKIMHRFKFVPVSGLPRFCGGMVGFIGYDMVRFFESKLRILESKKKEKLTFPDALFILVDNLLIFDHLRHKIKIVSCAFIKETDKPGRYYKQALKKIESMESQLKNPLKLKFKHKTSKQVGSITSNLSKSRFIHIVNRAKRYIKQGDVIQAVLSQRLKVRIKCNPLSIYRSLRSINPSPYMFFLKFKDLYLIGSSPEMLVRCEKAIVRTRPIAGTRPRGRNEQEDERLSRQLLCDKKENAEHIMLVDLGRNDLGRVCKFGTVKLSEFMTVVKYSHVLHITSEVTGKLSKSKDIYELLRSSFPAGTVTGSPKVRAMEIINELETTRRGPYAGCVGYFSFSGNIDTCITIRTIVLKGNIAYIQAGAGIVADSKPINEYNETLNKAKAMIEAIKTSED